LGNLIFLVGAITLSIVGSVLLWLRYRKPTSFMSSIDDFQAEMTALSADRSVSGPMAAERLRDQPTAGTQAAKPSDATDRLRTARDRATGRPTGQPTGQPSGRPTGLTAPSPRRARQGSTVKPTTVPKQPEVRRHPDTPVDP